MRKAALIDAYGDLISGKFRKCLRTKKNDPEFNNGAAEVTRDSE